MAKNAGGYERLIGTTIQDRYRVLSCIGEGGMGVVYEVEHVLIGRRFALKSLSPLLAHDTEVVARFHREARAAAAIGDKHIIEVSDMGMLPSGSPYIVMEFLEGHDLGKELQRTGPLPISRAIDIATQCCQALGKAHKKEIVHRDIKPDNIFLDKQQETADFVKILDFGISKAREAALGMDGSLKTKTGMALGTPYYMPPEQASGAPGIDARADVYAMGVVLFQMLIGHVPFQATTYPLLVVKILQEPPPSLAELRSDIPLELEQVVHRAMAKNPEERFSSMEEFAFALAPFSTLSGKAQLTSFGMAYARTEKVQSTPKAWEGNTKPTQELQDTQLPYRKIYGLKSVATVVAIVGLMAGAAIYMLDDKPESSVIPTPQQAASTTVKKEPIKADKMPVSPASEQRQQKKPMAQPSGVTTLESARREQDRALKKAAIPEEKSSSQDMYKRSSHTISRRKDSNRRRSSEKKYQPISSSSRDVSSTPVSRKDMEKPEATETRMITIDNQTRAGVEVTLKCGKSSKTINLSGKSKVPARVPKQDCRVQCSGIGGPRCPITLSLKGKTIRIH